MQFADCLASSHPRYRRKLTSPSITRRTMVSQLVLHERIETTVPKAKELRRVADQMITLGKEVRVLGAS